jgi:hypothetical protein
VWRKREETRWRADEYELEAMTGDEDEDAGETGNDDRAEDDDPQGPAYNHPQQPQTSASYHSLQNERKKWKRDAPRRIFWTYFSLIERVLKNVVSERLKSRRTGSSS